MKKLLLTILLLLTGCRQDYYRGQPVERGPGTWLICPQDRLPLQPEVSQLPVPNGISPSPATSSNSSSISGRDGDSQAKCKAGTTIKINGRVQEVDADEVVTIRYWP
jgi:hypothetical protein